VFTHACLLSVKAFIEIVEFLFTIPGVTVYLSSFLSQNTLEKFLAVNDNVAKVGENPNSHELCKNTQGVINLVCGNAPRGNCRGDKATIDWEAESKPLPKYRKATAENNPPIPSLKSTGPLTSTAMTGNHLSTTSIVTTNCRPAIATTVCRLSIVMTDCQSAIVMTGETPSLQATVFTGNRSAEF